MSSLLKFLYLYQWEHVWATVNDIGIPWTVSVSLWVGIKGTKTRIFTVEIVLPSCEGCFKVRVLDNSEVLELTVDLPKMLVAVQLLQSTWTTDAKFSDFYPKLLGFEASLKKISKKITDTVSSTDCIGLSCDVQSQIDVKYNIYWRDDTCRVLYVIIKDMFYDYAEVNDTIDLEFV